MKVSLVYLSPTGGTKKVLTAFTKDFEIENDIELSKHHSHTFSKDETVIIAAPVFGGRIVSVFIERLKNIRANGAKAVVIATFGNRDYDDALLELKNEATNSGFNVVMAIAAVTEHSLIRKFGKGRPNAEDRRDLASFAEILANTSLDSGFNVKGNTPYIDFPGLPIKPKANSKCVSCGTCASACPVATIPKSSPKETGPSCIVCMRCVEVCPEKARNISKPILFMVELKLKKSCSTPKKNECYYNIISN